MIAWLISFLVEWGYWGMLVAAFLAGSFFPFSSEAVMAGLQAAGLDPVPLITVSGDATTAASAMSWAQCSTMVWDVWARWNG